MELLDKVKEIAGPTVERIWNFEERRQALKRKVQELESMEIDINCQLKIKESLSGKKRKHEVENWLMNVERIKNEVKRIEQAVEESRWSRLMGEGMDKITEEVMELIEKGRFQGELVLDVHETGENLFIAAKVFSQVFQINKDKIWEYLTKDEVFSIGIYGMGGVGKTTLVTHIHNQLLESQNSFHHVYWITVSQDFNIYKLQNLIAKTIHLDLSNEDDEKKRAARLSKALVLKQKVLLVLDDLWNHFSLEKLGIPVGVNQCRLIFTTRSLDVCRRMGCQQIIKVEPLSEKEAWTLFLEKLGETHPPEVNRIAKAIATECAGLPLAIVTMAGSLRGVDDACEWRNALRELEESKGTQGDMESEVFRILKFSYDRLIDSALQQSFLYCALYPEGHQIDRKELIEYLIVEGVIGRGSRQAEYDEGHTILNRLEKVCLLESVRELGRRCVKMHDLIRDMAIQIMKAKPLVKIKASAQLSEMPDWGYWMADLVRISLMNNHIKEIPSGYSPKCPNLSTLLLCGNEQLRSIAGSFFEQLQGLKILDLSGTGIAELPKSVSNLVNLNALLLKFCYNLRHVPSVAKLSALRKLDLNISGLEELPEGMELLSNLRYLGLVRTKLKELPPGILPKLSSLQVLLLDPSLIVKGEEVASLRKLETLNCRFYDVAAELKPICSIFERSSSAFIDEPGQS